LISRASFHTINYSLRSLVNITNTSVLIIADISIQRPYFEINPPFCSPPLCVEKLSMYFHVRLVNSTMYSRRFAGNTLIISSYFEYRMTLKSRISSDTGAKGQPGHLTRVSFHWVTLSVIKSVLFPCWLHFYVNNDELFHKALLQFTICNGLVPSSDQLFLQKKTRQN